MINEGAICMRQTDSLQRVDIMLSLFCRNVVGESRRSGAALQQSRNFATMRKYYRDVRRHDHHHQPQVAAGIEGHDQVVQL